MADKRMNRGHGPRLATAGQREVELTAVRLIDDPPARPPLDTAQMTFAVRPMMLNR